MATGVTSWSQTAATNSSSDSAINWAEGQAPSTVNDSARGMMASTAKFRDDINGSLTLGGTSTAYTLTSNQGFASLTVMDKQTITVVPNVTSGATPTLAVDSLTAKPIRHVTGGTLPTGALIAGTPYRLTYYNTAGEFLVDGAAVASAVVAAGVTYSAIQNVGASSLIGNATGSPAAPTNITLGSGLAFSGAALTANPAAAQNYISGLTLSTAGGSGTMSIAAGVANDSTNTSFMTLASAISKTTASWVVGTGNGGIDTGSIANSTWYHFYEIMRVDTGVVDIIFSTSASAPTLPTNYTLYRRIGSGKTDASAHWILFTQTRNTFLWAVPAQDVAGIATTAARVTTALTVPTGVVVSAIITAVLTTGGGGSAATGIVALTETDAAIGNYNTNVATVVGGLTANQFEVITNTSAQVAVRSTNVNGTLSVGTHGWKELW